MITVLLILAIIGFLAVLTHRRSRLEGKIYKNVPLTEWLVILVFPIGFYICWVLIVKNILDRPKIFFFPLDDFDILAITILFMVYAFVGNAMHFTSKILWRYLAGQKNTMAYRVNEMFHGKLSHYLSYLNGLLIVFLLPILEINHPSSLPIPFYQTILIVLAALVFGMSSNQAIYYTNEWFGGYNKPLFFVVSFALLILITISRTYKLNFAYYPVTLFVTSLFVSSIYTFLIRQFFIFTKLGYKRRLHFLAKILSV